MGIQIKHLISSVVIEAGMLLIHMQLYYWWYLNQKTNLIYWSIDKGKVLLDNHMCEISQLKINTNDINYNHQHIKICKMFRGMYALRLVSLSSLFRK